MDPLNLELIQEFIKVSKQDLAQFIIALKAQKKQALQQLTHRFIGSAQLLGLTELIQCSQAFEGDISTLSDQDMQRQGQGLYQLINQAITQAQSLYDKASLI